MFKDRSYSIESNWLELTPVKFSRVATALLESIGEPVQDTRLRLLSIMLDKKFPIQRAGCKQKLAELTRWVFVICANPDVLEYVSPDLRDALLYCLPEEIDSPELIPELEQVYSLLNPSIRFNLAIDRNLYPIITTTEDNDNGPVFNVDKNRILETDLTAGEFLDASEYIHLFGQTNDLKYLANVAACLYRNRKEKYDTFQSQQLSTLYIDHEGLAAIWLMFISWQQYFSTHPVYGILFSEPEQTDNKKISLGSYELIYTFAKDGYGSIDNLTMMSVVDFFSLQVKAIKDAVAQYRAMKKTDGEIAKLLKIPFATIIKL